MALEACEFWSAYCEAELDNAVLRPFLPQVRPASLAPPLFSCRRQCRTSANVCKLFPTTTDLSDD